MVNKKKDIMFDILTSDEYDKLKNMVNIFDKNKNLELEVSFKDINYATFMRVSEYLVNITDKDSISSHDTLDINVILVNGNNYRISLLGDENINAFLKRYARSNMVEIQRDLMQIEKSDTIDIIFKDRGSAQKMFLEDFGIVFKLTNEIPVNDDNKPTLNGNEKILFRYKNRYSFVLDNKFRTDITEIQESTKMWNLTKSATKYEIEIEAIDKITTEDLLKEMMTILNVIQDTTVPIGKSESAAIVEQYRSLLGVKSKTHLETRTTITIQPEFIVKYIPNKYAITDKADGERRILFSNEMGIYLISANMTVYKTKLKVAQKKYQNMILDGEYVKSDNRFLFLVFDIIYADGIDYKHNDTLTLTVRLKEIDMIIDQCFGNLIPFTNYSDANDDMEIVKIKQFYTKEVQSYWKAFLKRLNKSSSDIFVTKKLYFVPFGIHPCEVFMYADMVWKMLVYASLAPYKLDGIIYTPINAPYMIQAKAEKVDEVALEYKWKSPSQNSIDFYIEFVKDANGNDSIFYDDAVVATNADPYKICILHVGISNNGQTKPIPFKVNGVVQKANIYLTGTEATDINGGVINSHTVVEFVFDNTKPDIDNAYKWIPLRTRYDKTESVQKYGQNYGNFLTIANRIWKTIINPITEENIAALGNPDTFEKELENLPKAVNNSGKSNLIYYQKKTRNAAGMRAFNNWIKSNMIHVYCKNKPTVLDIGCGRGGDINKFIQSGITEYVGIDIDRNGLYVINDSAYNRYKNVKNKQKNVPPMTFIQADARALFNVQAQENALANMTTFNKNLIETYLSKTRKYNVINAQFTLHYYLSDALSWSNFCQNINNHLENNGYVLITAFDGKLIHDNLRDKQKMTISYTENSGNKEIFFEIKKIYADNDSQGIGMAIDLYNSLISNPGTYLREYLVFPEFLEKSLRAECGLELVESESFFNIFNLYRDFFTASNTTNNTDTIIMKNYEKVREFYTSLLPNNHSDVTISEAMASFKLSMLNRYYVFKKAGTINISEPARIVNLNQTIDLGKVLMPYFANNKIVIDPAQQSAHINTIYHSILAKYHDVRPAVYLVRHSIINNNLDGEVYRRNKIEFSKIKNGDDKLVLIYKSPAKIFYPIFYKKLDSKNDSLIQSRIINDEEYIRVKKYSKSYLFNSSQLVNDLDILVALTNKSS